MGEMKAYQAGRSTKGKFFIAFLERILPVETARNRMPPAVDCLAISDGHLDGAQAESCPALGSPWMKWQKHEVSIEILSCLVSGSWQLE